MKRQVIIIAMAVLTLSFLAVPAFPGAVLARAGGKPSGSYLDSCMNEVMEGTTLIALCQTRQGNWVGSSLEMAAFCQGDIPNMNGHLSCQYPGGSWYLSCYNLNVNHYSGEITADCYRIDGSINKATHSPAGWFNNCDGNLSIAPCP